MRDPRIVRVPAYRAAHRLGRADAHGGCRRHALNEIPKE